ncbi:MAG: hypothetical protein NC212_05300 [Staphylococcus sp.]|nr:hypothetical protein [Staphylococcus sp.]
MNTRIALIALSLLSVATVSGQGLHKEINVDQEIVPVKRDASRINVLPTLSLPAISRPQLSFSDRVVTTRVPNSITTLAPVAYLDKLHESPYRGYVALGLGAPLFNATFSAGYRAIDTEKTRLSIWSQYDGDIYRDKHTDIVGGPVTEVTDYWRDHSATIGADLCQSVGKNTDLNANVDYTYAYHTAPIGVYTYSQNVSRANASVGLASHGDGLQYSIGARYGHFGFYHFDFPAGFNYLLADYPEKGARQNLAAIDGSVSLPMGETTEVAIDLSADFLHSSSHITPIHPLHFSFDNAGSETTGLIAVTPHFDFGSQAVKGHIGAEVDFSINDGKAIHIAPEVSFAWTPTQLLGIEIKAHGGSSLNSLAELYAYSPYLNPFATYGQSHIPVALDGRLTVGPFLGAYLELYGGYAKANGWLMPVENSYAGYGIFDRVDLSAWHAGAAIGYDWRDRFSARVSYETAPNDYDNSYYEWRDRAKHVVNAELKVRPIKPLLVTLGWEFRAGRHTYYNNEVFGDLGVFQYYTPVPVSLGCVSDLSLSAAYSVTDRLTVFLNGENLLNRRYDLFSFRPSQGTTVMVGASLKF